MAELERSQSDQGENSTVAEDVSYRSRASSVISTGTKFSIQTMPQGHFHIDGTLDGSISRNMTTRPASMYSVRSMAPSLPPYEGHQPMDALLSTGTHTGPLNPLQTFANHELQVASTIGAVQEQPLTPSDSENALTMHYGRVVRAIDDNHARQIARMKSEHEQKLAATRDAVREEIDQAYRKVLKAKDRETERIREEAANEIEQVRRKADVDIAAIQDEMRSLAATYEESVVRTTRENADRALAMEEEHLAAVEKARNAIEDLWEGRWNDRTQIAAEEAKRAAKDAERRERGKGEEWLRVIGRLHPELVDELQSAVESSRMQGSQLNESSNSTTMRWSPKECFDGSANALFTLTANDKNRSRTGDR